MGQQKQAYVKENGRRQLKEDIVVIILCEGMAKLKGRRGFMQPTGNWIKAYKLCSCYTTNDIVVVLYDTSYHTYVRH